MGPKEHWPSPKFCQQFALNFYVLNVFRVLRFFDWSDYFREHNIVRTFFLRVKINFHRNRIKISGRQVPMLSFSPVHWQLYNMTVFAVKGFIKMKYSLYVVFTRWYIGNFFNWIAKSM